MAIYDIITTRVAIPAIAAISMGLSAVPAYAADTSKVPVQRPGSVKEFVNMDGRTQEQIDAENARIEECETPLEKRDDGLYKLETLIGKLETCPDYLEVYGVNNRNSRNKFNKGNYIITGVFLENQGLFLTQQGNGHLHVYSGNQEHSPEYLSHTNFKVVFDDKGELYQITVPAILTEQEVIYSQTRVDGGFIEPQGLPLGEKVNRLIGDTINRNLERYLQRENSPPTEIKE